MFTYDGLNRLSSAVAPALWGTESYTYDPINNLRTRLSAGQTLVYNYDASNRLLNITRGASTVGSFGYDTRGNTITRNGITLLFDQKNQLTQLPGHGSYAYDANGRRVQKTPAGGASTYYFYNHAGQLLYQFEPGMAKGTNYIYLGTRMIARNSALQLTAPGAVSFDANPNNGSYTVSWGASTGASSYTLRESANGGAWTVVYAGAAASAALNGRAGGSYVYQVQACASSEGCSGWTGSATLGVRPALAAVTIPAGTLMGAYTVSWTAPAGATAYDVQERLNSGAWTALATNTIATSIGRPGTSSGSYTYQVSAHSAYGSRGWAVSNQVVVDTNLPPTSAPTLTVPVSNATGAYAVSWTVVPGTITSYTLQEQTNGGAWATVYASANTSWNASGHLSGSYGYRVQACSSEGCGPWSATKSVTVAVPPVAPATVIAPSYVHGVQYYVTWSTSVAATSYDVQRTNLGTGVINLIATTSATSTTIAAPTGTQNLQYAVRACNAAGCSAYKNAPNATATDKAGPIN